MLLSHKHSPTTILLATLDILLLDKLIQQFLNGSDADTRYLFHICERKCWFSTHRKVYPYPSLIMVVTLAMQPKPS